MNNIVNFITTWFISPNPYTTLHSGVAVILSVLLLVLLIERVLLEAYEGNPAEGKTQAFTIIIWPMLFVMIVLMCLRMAQILIIR